MENKVQLITYADRLTGGNLNDLNDLLSSELRDLFGGIHILPFFDPIDGADAGFDPIEHRKVDPRLGKWEDIKNIGMQTPVVADLIVNHISANSNQFKSLIADPNHTKYSNLFLLKETVFPNGISQEEFEKIYRPRPTSPFTKIQMSDGNAKSFWTTFSPEQIDIDVYSEQGQKYLSDIITIYSEVGVKLIRLDAVGYAIKKAGTSCFMIPETFQFINELTTQAHSKGIEVLVEIHSFYEDQIAIAERVDYVYDFALPPLVLHAIYNQNGQYLKKWLDIRPANAITVLDTHDGIGIIDIGPDQKDNTRKGLVPDNDVDALVKEMHKRSKGTSAHATGTAASNLDLYQVNSTYYEVLGCDDDLYLLARALQFFTPGIPQVYYLGLTCEKNDMELLKRTQVGRDINRHYYSKESIRNALNRDVSKRLQKLIRFRNEEDAFNGDLEYHFDGNQLSMSWKNDDREAILDVDFTNLSFTIATKKIGEYTEIRI